MLALVRLVGMEPFDPLLVARALPANETAIVAGRRIGGGRLARYLRLCLFGRRALTILKGPIAVGPILVGIALPVNKATIVDIHGRLLLGRSAVLNAGVADPIRHPDLIAVAVDAQPAVVVADDSERRAGRRGFYDAALQAVGSPQIGILRDADAIGLGETTPESMDKTVRMEKSFGFTGRLSYLQSLRI